MGLKTGTVKLEKHNMSWKSMFNIEKENLEKIFGNLALSIEHIGSTSVEGLSAKPIIDIAVGLKSLKDFNKVRECFMNEPYSVKEEPVEGEQLVRKGYPETSYLIHIMEIDSKRYKDTIMFRNYLRKHENTLKEYEQLKEGLAIKYKDNRKLYTASKNQFIKKVIESAYFEENIK